MTHAQKAVELHNSRGCNCASCVFTAFADLTGMEEETALKVSSAFGGGMGQLGQTCGAFSGMLMALGALRGITSAEGKKEYYAVVHELGDRFRAKAGELSCPGLLAPQGLTGSDPAILPKKKAYCNTLIALACDLLDEYLSEN